MKGYVGFMRGRHNKDPVSGRTSSAVIRKEVLKC